MSTGKRAAAVIWLGVALAACTPSAPPPAPQPVRAFGPNDAPIAQTGVSPADGGWRIERGEAGSVPLFEVPNPGVENATLAYRAQMRSAELPGKAYLEMWVRVPGRGEFFSRGLAQPLHGASGWARYEIPFFLNEPGVRPDLVKLNVAFEGGGGTIFVKDVELLQTPLAR